MSHTTVDSVLQSMRDGDSTSPVSDHLGMRLVDFGRGRAVYELRVSEQLVNQFRRRNSAGSAHRGRVGGLGRTP